MPPSRATFGAGAILALALAAPLPAAVFYVGDRDLDPECDADTLAAALLGAALSAGADEIRIANNQTYTAQRVATGAQTVTLRGGYSDCSDTTASASGTTLAGTGGASAPVIEIDATGAETRHRIDLVNLTLTAGEEGGLDVRGNITVVLANTHVQFNDPERGIEVDDTASVTLRTGSTVSNNGSLAPLGISGGGIRCDGGALDVEDAHVFNNAAFSGGGVFATGGCRVDLARTAALLFGAPGGVFQNEALSGGGGIYLSGGADLVSQPYRGQTVIHGNRALFGAGLYLTGVDTTALLYDTLVTDNEASEAGGGIYVGTNAFLRMDRGGPTWECPLDEHCSRLLANRVPDSGDGGGGLFVSGGEAELRSTLVEANETLFGAAGWVESGGSLELESSVVAKNVGAAAFQVMDGGLELRFVTAVGGTHPESLDVVYDMGSDLSVVTVRSSILGDQPLGGYVDGGAGHTIDCVVAPYTNLWPGTVTRYYQAPTGVRDVAAGDYHLRPDAVAIDLCPASAATPTAGVGDVDDNARPLDLAAIANVHGAHDAGADEVTASELVGLFEDGFELGGTGAWSDTTPP